MPPYTLNPRIAQLRGSEASTPGQARDIQLKNFEAIHTVPEHMYEDKPEKYHDLIAAVDRTAVGGSINEAVIVCGFHISDSDPRPHATVDYYAPNRPDRPIFRGHVYPIEDQMAMEQQTQLAAEGARRAAEAERAILEAEEAEGWSRVLSKSQRTPGTPTRGRFPNPFRGRGGYNSPQRGGRGGRFW